MYCLASRFIQIGASVEGQKALPYVPRPQGVCGLTHAKGLGNLVSINEHSSRISKTLSYGLESRNSIWYMLPTEDFL